MSQLQNIEELAEIPKGLQLYDWEDHATSRRLIEEDVKSTMEKQFKEKEHNGVKLSITNIHYADPEHYSISEQKKILHNDGFLGRRLKGTVTLRDSNTGELLDEKKNMTLMKVPYLTGRGTFIREGNEWGTINQTRLLPGAYSRYQNNGDLETQFNVRPGTGGSIKVNFDPESAVYKFKTAGQEFHLYSLLNALGVPDEELKKRWGEEIFEKNKVGYDSRTLEKAYQKIVPEWDRKQNPGRTDEQKIQLVKNALNRAQMATAVAKVTLPNLFDRTKSANWQKVNNMRVKLAALNTEELQDVATYINEAGDKSIDTSTNKTQLEEQIKSIIISGLLPQQKRTPADVDPEDNAASVVRSMKEQRMFKTLQNKLNKSYAY